MTSFPTGLDSFVDPLATDTTAAVPHHSQHGNANDAIVAIETKLGVDGSAVAATIDHLLKASANPGHTHTSSSAPGTVTSVQSRTGAVVLVPADGNAIRNVVSKTTTYTAATGDVVLANGTFTITSPPAATGAQVIVKNTGTGTVTFTPAAGTIDGAASMTITIQYEAKTFVSDGTNWFAI